MSLWEPSESNSDKPTTKRICLRKHEAASAIGVSERTLHNLLKSGEIGSIKLNRAVLVPIAEIEDFISKRTNASMTESAFRGNK